MHGPPGGSTSGKWKRERSPHRVANMSEGSAPRRSARSAGKAAETPAPAAAPKRKAPDATASAKAATAKKSKPAAAEAVKPVKSAGGQLKVGDALPAGLKLKTQSGEELDVSKLRKTVLFSYPRANTSGCTTQAKLYRDSFDDFTAAGYTIYGLSNDSPTSLKSWKDKQQFQYDLISDPQRELIHALTGSNDKTRRSHFVVGEDGNVALISISVKPPEVSRGLLADAARTLTCAITELEGRPCIHYQTVTRHLYKRGKATRCASES